MSEPSEVRRNAIVAATDMEETGEFALREAMRLARQLPGAELHAVYVIPVSRGLHSAKKLAVLGEQLEQARLQLAEHVTDVCRPLPPEPAFDQAVTLHVRIGAPPEAILQVAIDEEADLIVVGTHGRTGVKRWVLGSVAEELMRIARAPVIVAHPKHYEGLTKSPKPEAARPGEDLSPQGLTERLTLHFPQRSTHISGLV